MRSKKVWNSLFHRTTRGVVLTDAGEILLTYARRLVDDAEAARERAKRAGRGEIGHLSVALPVVQTLAPMTAEMLRKYREEVPGVSITLRHLLSAEQTALLSSGRLDVGVLLVRPTDDPLFRGIHIFSEKMLLAYPAAWQWKKRSAAVAKGSQRPRLRMAPPE